jgi:hypothetical protein
MLSWLYDIFVAVVTFVMSLFGFDLKKRSVTFADDVKDTPKESETTSPDVTSPISAKAVAEVLAGVPTETTPVTEST